VNSDGAEYILDDDECPLSILMNHPTSRGELLFLFFRVILTFSIVVVVGILKLLKSFLLDNFVLHSMGYEHLSGFKDVFRDNFFRKSRPKKICDSENLTRS
jgi:hypothetical protein